MGYTLSDYVCIYIALSTYKLTLSKGIYKNLLTATTLISTAGHNRYAWNRPSIQLNLTLSIPHIIYY